MSDTEQIKIISTRNSSDIDNILKEIEGLEKKREYYYALYKLEKFIITDGTIEKLNDKFLNLILDHYDEIMNQIKNFSSINLDESEEKMNEDAIGNAKSYNFYYFRDCFDKYEFTLGQSGLNKILDKKKKHNNKIIEKYPLLKEEYSCLISQIENKEDPPSADTIYEAINKLNESIISDDDTKLFYIYEYLDVDLIISNKIFDLICNNRFYLNRYSFGTFWELGIPIGFSNNNILKYRYIFLLIKNKILEIDMNNNLKNELEMEKKAKINEKNERKTKNSKKEEAEEKKEEVKKSKKEEDKKVKMEEDEEDKKVKMEEDKKVKMEEDEEESKGEKKEKDKMEENGRESEGEKKEEDKKVKMKEDEDESKGEKKEEDKKDKIEEDKEKKKRRR